MKEHQYDWNDPYSQDPLLKKLPDNASFRQRVAGMNKDERWEYIWTYYRWVIYAGMAVIALATSLICSAIVHKDTVMNVIMVDSDTYDHNYGARMFEYYLETHGYNTKRKEVSISDAFYYGSIFSDTQNYVAYSAIAARLMSGESEIIAGPEEFWSLFPAEDYVDLSTVLDEQYLEEHQDQLFYMTNTQGQLVPVGIYPSDVSRFLAAGYFTQSVPVGIGAGCVHRDEAVRCLKWLLEEANTESSVPVDTAS